MVQNGPTSTPRGVEHGESVERSRVAVGVARLTDHAGSPRSRPPCHVHATDSGGRVMSLSASARSSPIASADTGFASLNVFVTTVASVASLTLLVELIGVVV